MSASIPLLINILLVFTAVKTILCYERNSKRDTDLKISFQPHIKDEHLPLAPKMKGSDDISSDPSNINEDDVSICDLSENGQEKGDNKIMNIAHKVTSVTQISPSPPDYHVKQESDNAHVLFASYYREDRFKVYKGLPNLRCMFCESYSPIKFDMELHLYDNHREDLLYDLPIKKKKGFRMNDRIDYAINLMESEAHKSKRYFG